MAAAMARAIRTAAVSPIALMPKRFVSSSGRPPLLFSPRRLVQLSPASASRLTHIRCWARWSIDSFYWPNNCGFQTSGPVAELGPLFPDGSNRRWVILMDRPAGEGATTREMINAYIQTLAKVVGSEEEAFKRIYKVCCEGYFGFACEIDKETSNKLCGLPGVLVVFPDTNDNHCEGKGGAVLGLPVPKWYVRDEVSKMIKKLKQLYADVEQLEILIHRPVK